MVKSKIIKQLKDKHPNLQVSQIKDIFNTGYNIHFPKIDDQNKQLEYYTILNSIEEIKSSSGFGSDPRLDEFLQSFEH